VTTVLAVYNSEGCVGRCDAKCHNATTRDCDCICGGANHGGGTQRAIDNTREHAAQLVGADTLEAFEAQHRLGARRVELGPDIAQLDLIPHQPPPGGTHG